jgi:hypothetical protein
MASKGAIIAGVIIGGVVLGGVIYLIVKSNKQTSTQSHTAQKRLTARNKVPQVAWPSGEVIEETPSLPNIPSEAMEQVAAGQDGTFYLNKEKWHIEWNEDGLPVDITIERNAQRH